MSSTNLQAFTSAFQNRQRAEGSAKGLFGRIIRGTRPEHFASLTHESDRLIVLLLGQDGLENLLGLTGRQVLVDIIKYTDHHIQDLIAEGYQFKLAVFEGNPAEVLLATWDNTVDIAARTYPLVKDKLFARLDALKLATFQEIQQAATFDFYKAYKAGDKHPDFMTYDRLQKASGTLVEVRAFLFNVLHLREPYEGTGYTGAQCEYFRLNARLQDLGGALLPIEVV